MKKKFLLKIKIDFLNNSKMHNKENEIILKKYLPNVDAKNLKYEWQI